ncbi:hypothetical protein METBIDRAFT_30497 [Metschnikowia bicuspidata var. bicuspidata NRRL YB-4993]|uniref:Uncharacterized protein n=1 Tax=Metschnikowia bicuspidata var. bicuspidata NRRL YB-4993 TaxID=869754 RepID=A0A1A0HJV1_9ASCO|nr:hypothetical protein METBIDRAFT_30497 [Metschnikowia bicuspidata var. bicuspidata NRRL YB-4993]OBA24167.1 hypothetical protein METBIDRAFT_30497 [Metschnikowia bicuspidata var. bicuspidata NRRL YB-4993]
MFRSRYKDPYTVDRRVCKLANLISVVLLYSAASTNHTIPKDYLLLYLCETYYGKLVPPSSPIVVSPSTAAYFKLGSYKANSWVRKTYEKKHFILFPVVCGQILLNYLTPTQYKLNQRYFSVAIKRVLLDPIWTHFRMGVGFQAMAWRGLLVSYARHNGLLFLYMAALNFRTRLWRPCYKLGSELELGGHRLRKVCGKYILYCAQRANTVANFVYAPNLLSMVLLSKTAPLLAHWRPLKTKYMVNQKQTVKWYMRSIGFLAGLAAMLLHTIKYVTPIGRKSDLSTYSDFYTDSDFGPESDLDTDSGFGTDADSEDEGELDNPRVLGPDFYNSICIYLTQLIVLSKWRIVKENHPWFTVLKVGTWRRMETGLMCLFVWKLMNLNDHVTKHTLGSGSHELQKLRLNPWIKAVNRIMH